MMDHWQDLQRHILPGVLGAVRIANPGVNVQIFWETTGKTQDQRAPAHKTQRHFNDFPDIDIVVLEEWPEVHLVPPESPQPTANSPLDMSDEELPSPISPIDMINSNPGSLSLVSRMQALHGLANRRRPSEGRRRPSVTRASFFRETSSVPSPRRERLVSNKNGGKEKEKLRQLSMATGPGVPTPNFSSALDLRGLAQQPGLVSPVDDTLTNGGSAFASSSANTSPQRMHGLLSSSPGSDTSGSALSTLSPLSHRNIDKSFIEGDSHQSSLANGQAQSILYPLKYGNPAQVPSGQYFSGPSTSSNSLQSDHSVPISPILYQTPIARPLPYGGYSESLIPSLPSYTPYPTYSNAVPAPLAFAGNSATLAPLGTVASSTSSHLSALDAGNLDEDVVPASAPPDSRGQVPFVFDAAYEAQSAVRLRRAIDSMHEGDVVQSSAPANGFGSASNGVSMSWDEGGFMQGHPEFSTAVSQDYFSYDRSRKDGRLTNAYSLSPAEQYV
ncbi:hypothetical protein EW145_g4391 [Phellinidium pouzarii]|uniref:Uncharacterized protein n=1 Tax=Phellinidium pouzarii TaxID=167371 RepID=A0A4V3XCI4_9AGAM|nr:hypothetical protein EW145_g4391 [Phellinidium pouzarii]